MKIQITQFLRPDGRKRALELEIPDEYQEQYDLIRSCGCEITCEQMMNGTAAQYITNDYGDFDIKLSPSNDLKAADKALLQMIKGFDKKEFDKWNGQFEPLVQETLNNSGGK